VDYGFDPSAPSIVYLLVDRRQVVKVGITNSQASDSRGRVARHKRNGWTEVAVWALPSGSAAREVERAILCWWRDDLGLPPAYHGRDGDTETVDARKAGLGAIRDRIEAEIAALR
jgi:hypothetical protein